MDTEQTAVDLTVNVAKKATNVVNIASRALSRALSPENKLDVQIKSKLIVEIDE